MGGVQVGQLRAENFCAFSVKRLVGLQIMQRMRTQTPKHLCSDSCWLLGSMLMCNMPHVKGLSRSFLSAASDACEFCFE